MRTGAGPDELGGFSACFRPSSDRRARARKQGRLARSLLVGAGMPPNKTVVELYEPRTERTLIQTFARSPVVVGSSPRTALRLEDPAVAPVHGEIWFGEDFLSFGNLASKTWLDDHPLEVGVLAPLTDSSALMVGPYCLTIYRLGARRPGTPVDETAVPRTALDFWPPQSTKFLTRALSVLTEFADALVDLKKGMVLPTGSILDAISDPDDMLAYLLDPSAPDARVEELRSELDLVIAGARRTDVGRQRGCK